MYLANIITELHGVQAGVAWVFTQPKAESTVWGSGAQLSPGPEFGHFPGLAGGLKARNVTARAGASIASGGPGNARQIYSRGLKGRNRVRIPEQRTALTVGDDRFGMFTWGFAPCASPQAFTWRAFSPQNVQTPLPPGHPSTSREDGERNGIDQPHVQRLSVSFKP